VLHVMLRALLGACLANVGARSANDASQLAPARHVTGGESADLRAVDIKLNTARHLRCVWVRETRARAV